MAFKAGPRRRPAVALLIAAAGIGLAYVIENIGVGWVERHSSTLISAVWLYLPLPFILRSRISTSDYGIGFGTGFKGLFETLGVSIGILIPFYAVFFSLYPIHWFNEAFSGELAVVAPAQLLVVALPEEFFFRGYLQTELERAGGKKWNILGAEIGLGWAATAFIFALAHMATMPTPFRIAVIFPALLFGWVRARTKSILYPSIMHALFNFTFLVAQRMIIV